MGECAGLSRGPINAHPYLFVEIYMCDMKHIHIWKKQRRYPNWNISLSHEVCAIWREFERVSTTIADAFVKAVTTAYVSGLREQFCQLELRAPG